MYSMRSNNFVPRDIYKNEKSNFFYFCKLIMDVIDATGVSEQRNGVKNDLDIKHIFTEKS